MSCRFKRRDVLGLLTGLIFYWTTFSSAASVVSGTNLINVDFTSHLSPGVLVKTGPAAVGDKADDYWNVYSRNVTS
ncbi:MAG: hypothetical protein K0Q55_1050, partial [Verrucomicrobia bacterium]|nr:hypothetical protein [Verrucomicrobiota bacterium]